MKACILSLLFILPQCGWAIFWQGHDKGWHWYELHDNTADKAVSKKKMPSQPQEATATIEVLRISSEQALHQAILHPSETNVLQYLRTQQQLLAMASNFSSQWQKVVWQHPEIDDSINYPTSDVGQQIHATLQREQQTKALQQLPHDYGLFFYFDSHCPYCKKMAPTVKNFSALYGFELLPITIDGGVLPEFPEAKADNGSARQLNIQAVPALYLIHHRTQSIMPVGFGLLSMDDIENRIVTLMGEGISESKQRPTSSGGRMS